MTDEEISQLAKEVAKYIIQDEALTDMLSFKALFEKCSENLKTLQDAYLEIKSLELEIALIKSAINTFNRGNVKQEE